MARYFVNNNYDTSYFQCFKSKKQLFKEMLDHGTVVYKVVPKNPDYTLAIDKVTLSGVILEPIINNDYEDEHTLITGVKRFIIEDAKKVKLVRFSEK